ncbi:type IV pilus biogenesis/stability protein PilW [Herminiimonas arsenitoxidans]|uniref:type IV pilus biogenesis/stability protein PilW n=1 Tax=Herminiimonas arsenitoxidans TaxID=1809410 RepID=UPI00097130A0|nr:type IV pilus biogenesis/stability protein PilW [Herminiimonas arsenitoxidans]
MTVRRSGWLVVSLLSAILLLGCAARPVAPDGELTTSFDKTENQRRARIRLQLAIGYYQQGQMTVALDETKLALQTDPNFADAYSMAALIYMDQGEARLAEENFQRAIRLAPNDPDLSNNYGWFLCQNGRANQSIAYFESALRSKNYQSPAKALNNAGTCSLILKDKVAAERYFTEAFRQDPGNPTTSTNLARLNYERGDLERAKFYINRVTKADVLSAEVLWLAIKIERKVGDRAAESSLVTQLRRRYPDSTEFAAYQRGAFNE